MNINQEIFAFGKKGIHIFIQPTVAPSMSSCEIPDKATMSKRGKHQKDLDSHIAYINIKKTFYPKILGLATSIIFFHLARLRTIVMVITLMSSLIASIHARLSLPLVSNFLSYKTIIHLN